MTTKRDIEFLYEIGGLRHLQRSWRKTVGMDVANDLEHTVRVIWLSLILARTEGACDEEKIMKMALVHDVVETRTGDQDYIEAVYVKTKEKLATSHTFAGTSLQDFNEEILNEYIERSCIEAQIVKDADNLDVDIELRELANVGSKMLDRWRETRRKVRNEKLYTQAARDLWDVLEEVDVADWHMAANKWYKISSAGK